MCNLVKKDLYWVQYKFDNLGAEKRAKSELVELSDLFLNVKNAKMVSIIIINMNAVT